MLVGAKVGLRINTVRKTSVTMPSGNVLSYGYNSASNALDDDSSRLSKITDGGVRLVDYDYLGAAQVVGTDHSQPDIMWNMYGSTSGSYPDLDRFNRVTSSRWTKDLSTDVDFYDVDIAYDRSSNITLVEDNVHTGFDVSYTMDALDRLTQAEEGSWSGSAITSKTRDQLWTLGHTGNWDVGKLDLNGDGDFVDTDEQNDDRTHNAVNELTGRDIDDDGTDDFTLVYDEVGNLTDDGENYKYEWDVFGRMRKIKNQSDALVAEYKYNGLGFQISEHADTDDDGDVDASDKWFHSAFDERWRTLATFREDDSDPKEEFVHHQSGLGGQGGSSYINAVVSRDKDANTSWTAASDGVLEQRHYYCQNWRGDVSALITSGGYQVEWAKYSAYGVPFGIPGADTDSDGDCDSTDVAQIQSWVNAASYDVRGDVDLDGDIDGTDKSTVQTAYAGTVLGRTVLSSIASGNRRAYSGYSWSGQSLFYRARRRNLHALLGNWGMRDPLGFVGGYNAYQYVESLPIRYVDPSGLAKCELQTTVLAPPMAYDIPPGPPAVFVQQFIRTFPGLNGPNWFTKTGGNTCKGRGIWGLDIERYPFDPGLSNSSKCIDECFIHGDVCGPPSSDPGCMAGRAKCPGISDTCTTYVGEPWPKWSMLQSQNELEHFAIVLSGATDFTSISSPAPMFDPAPAGSSELKAFIDTGTMTCPSLLDTSVPSALLGSFRSGGVRATPYNNQSKSLTSRVGFTCRKPQLDTGKKFQGDFESAHHPGRTRIPDLFP